MTQHLLPSGGRAGAIPLCATTALVLALQPTNAGITEIDINRATPQALSYGAANAAAVP
jgi:hypothetical protein